MTPEQFRQSLFVNKEESYAYSPFGKNHFHAVVLQDSRYPKPIFSGGKHIWSVAQLEEYWRKVSETGFEDKGSVSL